MGLLSYSGIIVGLLIAPYAVSATLSGETSPTRTVAPSPIHRGQGLANSQLSVGSYAASESGNLSGATHIIRAISGLSL